MKCSGLDAPDPSLGDAKLVITPSGTGCAPGPGAMGLAHIYAVRHVRQPHPAPTVKGNAVQVQAPSYTSQVPITEQPHAASGYHPGEQGPEARGGRGQHTGHQQGLRKEGSCLPPMEGECLEFWWVPAPAHPTGSGTSRGLPPTPFQLPTPRGGHQLHLPSLGPGLGVDMGLDNATTLNSREPSVLAPGPLTPVLLPNSKSQDYKTEIKSHFHTAFGLS